MTTLTADDQKFTPKGLATRERIVEAAARLIHERGVAGTTTEEVRDAADVSSSQLYHYFKDKLTLVRAVIAYQTDAVIGAQAEFLRHLDSMQALRQWRDLLVRFQRGAHCAGGCPLGTLSSEIAEIVPEFRIDLNRAFTRWEDGIRSGLRAMHARGVLRKDADPAALATATMASIQGGLLLTQVRRDPHQLRIALNAARNNLRAARAVGSTP